MSLDVLPPAPGEPRAYMNHPDIWIVNREFDPERLCGIYSWILDDPDRAEQADEDFRSLGIGMRYLTLGLVLDAEGKVAKKVEANHWDENFPAYAEVGGHGHSRVGMEQMAYSHPDAYKWITFTNLLPPEAMGNMTPAQIRKIGAEARQLAILHKIDHHDGLGPRYHPVLLDQRLVTEKHLKIPFATRQKLLSTDVHEVWHQGPGMSVTIQTQGPIEDPLLNTTIEGLMYGKELSRKEAEEVLQQREGLEHDLVGSDGELTASTVLVRQEGFTPDQIDDGGMPTEPLSFERCAQSAMYTLQLLAGTRRAMRDPRPRYEEKRPMEFPTLNFDELEPEVQENILAAERVANESAYPPDKTTKVGCAIAAGDREYTGANAKTDLLSDNITCAEESAVIGALRDVADLKGRDEGQVDRVVVYSNTEKPFTCCPKCRGKLMGLLNALDQSDVTIYMSNGDKSTIEITSLSTLLPASPESRIVRSSASPTG